MFSIVAATTRDRDLVLALVDRLLRELEDRPEEFAGLDRARVLREMASPPGKRWARTVKFYESQGFVFTGPKLRCTLV